MGQLKAGIKKEWLELSKTYRLIGLVLAFLGFGILDPLLIRGMGFLADLFQDSPGMASLGMLAGQLDQSVALSSFAGDCTNSGILIVFLLLMRTAGGEQKKRNCIIPITLGFDRECYIYSKFLVYPPVCFVLTFLGYLVAFGTSSILFIQDLPFSSILFPAAMLALYVAFQVSLYLGLGCATAKAGVWVAVLYALHTILTMVLTTMKWNLYNPFALVSLGTSFGEIDPVNASVSIGLAVCVIVVCAVGSAMVFKRKKLV